MARLPDINGRRPTPRATGPASVNISARNNLGALGQGLSVLGEAIQQEQIKEDKLRAEDAFNRLQKKRLELTNGEEGFSNVKSYDVVSRPLYKEYNEQFDKAADEISNELSNDEQKKMFRRRADVSRLQYATDLTNHVQREKEVYAKQVFEGGKAVELQNAAENWSQPGAIKFSIERTKRLIEQQADREGWSPDVRKSVTKESTSAIHQSVISNAVANENAEYAQAYFDKNKKNIDSTKHDEITNLIRQTSLRTLSQTVADEIMAEDIGESDAMAKVRKKYKGDEEAAIVAALKTRYSEQRDVKKQSELDATDTAWEIYNNAVDQGHRDPYSAIPVNILESMDQKSRAVLKGRQKGGKQQSGSADYYKLRLMMMEDPQRFRDPRQTNLLSYDLSDSDRKELIKAQTDPVEIDYFDSGTSIVNEGLFAIGLEKKDLQKDNSNGEKARAFHNRVRQEQEAYQRRTGKKMDDKELRDTVDRLTIEVMRKQKPLFGQTFHDITHPDFLPGWMTEPMGTTKEAAAITEVEGVPNDVIDELAKSLRDAGYPVTQENIRKLYNAQ